MNTKILKSEKTKADALLFLKNLKSKEFIVEEIFVFTVKDWRAGRESLVADIIEKFSPGRIVARSSAVNEDTSARSLAGHYISRLNIDSKDPHAVIGAIDQVIQSYGRDGEMDLANQILVQPQTLGVVVGGVVFTRHNETGAPYYVINFDDKTGKTDTVTSGKKASLIHISHFVAKFSGDKKRWEALIRAVRRIENVYGDMPLDIEFAVTKKGSVVIYQVRPLVMKQERYSQSDKEIRKLILDIKNKFKRLNEGVPHLSGKRTILGDMPDWNPAEILGDRPDTLAYSLYGHIITDEIWLQARRTLGYSDVFPGELMIALGKKPYIDTRLSFNSFVPASLERSIKDKLVDYYLDKLAQNRHLQDKVEFEILWTCYDFKIKDDILALLAHGFTRAEVNKIVKSLHLLTVNILKSFRALIEADLGATDILTQRRDAVLKQLKDHDTSIWEVLTTAHYILENCKQYGTLPFSRLARLAFIGKSLLLTLRDQNIITEEFYQEFLGSVETVATGFNNDLHGFQKGRISQEAFLKKYGHLRLGTYDISAPTYKDLLSIFKDDGEHVKSQVIHKKNLRLDLRAKRKINRALRENGLGLGANEFLRFVRWVLAARETSKFEFTKSLSSAIDLIVLAGNRLGFSKEEMAHVDYPTLMKFRNPEFSDEAYAKKIIGDAITRHRRNKDLFEKVILPPVVADQEDFDFVSNYESRPNFITKKVIKGKVRLLNKTSFTAGNADEPYIYVTENADPGYDWIFSRKPLGLITKYGGVASHMAIRCAEFGLPAAIGCGDAIYKEALGAEVLLMDCKRMNVRVIR